MPQVTYLQRTHQIMAYILASSRSERHTYDSIARGIGASQSTVKRALDLFPHTFTRDIISGGIIVKEPIVWPNGIEVDLSQQTITVEEQPQEPDTDSLTEKLIIIAQQETALAYKDDIIDHLKDEIAYLRASPPLKYSQSGSTKAPSQRQDSNQIPCGKITQEQYDDGVTLMKRRGLFEPFRELCADESRNKTGGDYYQWMNMAKVILMNLHLNKVPKEEKNEAFKGMLKPS